MKKVLMALAAVLLTSAIVYGINGRLPVDGTGKYPLPGYAATSAFPKKQTAQGVRKYVNYTTANFTAVKCTSRSATGTAVPVKVRIGGYATGTETDTYATSEDVFWAPPGKLGFMNMTATSPAPVDVYCSKQDTF